MKNFLIGLSLLLSASSFAYEKEMDWIDHYVLAQEAVGRKDGSGAIWEYTKAIGLNPGKLFLYVQRGQIYEKKHQWEDAIRDYTHVINSPDVHPSILLHALYGRGRCYIRIDGLESYLLDKENTSRVALDLKRAEAMDTSLVHTEENERYSIEWNISEEEIHSPEFRKEYAKMMVEIGDCQSTKDVKFFDNWTIVTKLKTQKPSAQSCALRAKRIEKLPEVKKNDNYIPACARCGQPLNDVFTKIDNPTDETDCQWWCDKIATSSKTLCYKHFKSAPCRYACKQVVNATKKVCYRCCKGDGFYKNCVKPFEDFLERVGCEDPIW